MKHIFILKSSTIWRMVILALFLVFGGNYALHSSFGKVLTVNSPKPSKEFTIITTEFSSKMDNGKVMEVYRWDPGMIVVDQGDHVTLNFIGVQGKFHAFDIKGLGLSGEVKKGEKTQVSFTADKKGTYQIVCKLHADLSQNGPMIGNLVVK
jgi:plastocyanin